MDTCRGVPPLRFILRGLLDRKNSRMPFVRASGRDRKGGANQSEKIHYNNASVVY